MTKEELAELMRELIDLGEDQGELSMWHKLYDTMNEEEKKALCENLQNELKELKAL